MNSREILEPYKKQSKIAQEEFPDLVEDVKLLCHPSGEVARLRLLLIDGSFTDIWYSVKRNYSYHWQKQIDKICRHDNAPHRKWKFVRTFPKHFHNGKEEKVEESNISDEPLLAIREWLDFIRGNIKSAKSRL